MVRTKVFHSDAGHGWLAVKRQELVDLNIINDITVWSYQKGKTVYLEEDCDAETYLKAIQAIGDTLEIKHAKNYDYSPIRSYYNFHAYNFEDDWGEE